MDKALPDDKEPDKYVRRILASFRRAVHILDAHYSQSDKVLHDIFVDKYVHMEEVFDKPDCRRPSHASKELLE